MDYIGKKCPVCQKYFHADDDIVVCPECGTPHHRECYEQTGHCCNEHLHAEGFDYQKENTDTENNKLCPSCGKEVDADAFFCKHCGAPLSPDRSQNQQQASPQGQGFPFGAGQGGASNNGAGFNGIPFMDPLGGVPGDTDLGDGVTAGEAAKYVKQNTPYFIRIFSNIKNLNKSKFNFAAALFTGGYMMYRKMYKLGALFVTLQFLMLIVEAYISIAYSSLFTELVSISSSSMNYSDLATNFLQFMQKHSVSEMLVLYLPLLIDVIRLAMMVVIGACFNRMYFKHCKTQINKIKQDPGISESPETVLQTQGGVNTALAVSLLVAYIIITYLPNIIMNFL